jgi:glycosyltransferase involved in cell wall biosynthesis
MKILIVSGATGKFFHLNAFGEALKKLGVEYKLINELEYGLGFPSKNIRNWFNPGKKFKKLLDDFKPDCVFVDRQARIGMYTIQEKIPLFVLLRGDYWYELEWAKKTIAKNTITKMVLWMKNKIAEKCFREATAIFPICVYLENIVKEHYPKQNTHVFFEGIDSSNWFSTDTSNLKHPCVGLLQAADWWGKAKEMLVLKKVMKELPNVNFYWVGDGDFREKIVSEFKEFKNFNWLGHLQYPEKVREFLNEIDVYALTTGMDTAPLTLKEAQLMKKPVIATDVGGVNEMMKNNENGFLVEEGNSQDLLNKLNILISNKELSLKMGESGRKFVEETFSWDVCAKKFLESIDKYIQK